MLEKIQAFLRRFNPHSKVFIIGGFSALFLLLIFITVSVRTGQQQQTRTEEPTPTPRVLTPGKDFVEGQINVKFIEGMSDFEINQRLAKYNSRIKSTISGINVKVVEVPVGQEEAITKKLIEEGVVKYAELNYTTRAIVDPNDTHFGLQYGLKNTGQDIKGKKGTINSDVHAEEAWSVTKGDGVKVAIIDTGIDPNHPEFAGKIVAQKTFVSSLSADDGFGHGTHVAGTVTANTNNEQGVAGTCPNCQLIIAKVNGDDGSGELVGLANGITWSADNGAKVMNISIILNGGMAPETIKEAINYAWGKGTVIIAAAGNCGSSNYFSNGCSVMNQVLYPAAFPNVVSVANIDNKDLMNPTSNHGTWVDVAAYGTEIVSTLPTHQHRLGALNYGYLTGTSMASPMVAGVAGLVWGSQYGTSNQAVVDRLLNTADNISGTGTYWAKGRVNAAAAVGASNITPTITPTITPGITASPSATVVPTVPPPTSGVTPTTPVPTFVCGGSPNSVCNSPTPTRGPNPTTTPNPTITQGGGLTGTPTISPSVTPGPDTDCLDPRSTPERIRDWVSGFIKKIQDYIQRVLGNPTDPNRPPPPQPCIIRQ